MITPIEKHGQIWIKRDDYFKIGNVCGGKARACFEIAKGAKGLTTAASRMSPQVMIVSEIAKLLGIPCSIHTSNGKLTKEIEFALNNNAKHVSHSPGYNNQIKKEAKEEAIQKGWKYIPFGMESEEAVNITSLQVEDFPKEIKRVVVPVGSGITISGILKGMIRNSYIDNIELIGIIVGADPIKRLNKYAPLGWHYLIKLIKSKHEYSKSIDATIDGVELDPIYESKCLEFVKSNDLFWIVGKR